MVSKGVGQVPDENDRLRLKDLEQRLRTEDPGWVRQFDDPPKPSRSSAGRDIVLETVAGLLAVAGALAILFGSAAAIPLLAAAGMFTCLRYT